MSIRTRLSPALVATALPLAFLLTACGDGEGADATVDSAASTDSAAVAAPASEAAPAQAVGPTADLPPNEVGEIMVLEYHRLGENEGEFIRKKENFQNDLQSLYDRGYRPVTMRQVLEGNIDIPAGTTPVVFTIDDSSRGQFHHLADGTTDPNSMVGMWNAFKAQNPGWTNGAVWCVLPAADHPSNFFGEKPSREVPREERETTIRNKVQHLVENGHEICNHTLYHARLDRASSDEQVQEWIGRGEDSIQVYLPEGYDIVTLALPLGQWPDTRSLAWRGSWKGKPYEYGAVLEVSGGPNVSVFDKQFDPHSVDRFIVAPGHLERQLDAYDANPSRRYVSDGQPGVITVPQDQADRVDRSRWSDKEVRVAEPTAAPPRG